MKQRNNEPLFEKPTNKQTKQSKSRGRTEKLRWKRNKQVCRAHPFYFVMLLTVSLPNNDLKNGTQ